MPSHIKDLRLNGLPEAMRSEIIQARRQHHWSQRDLGEKVGLPQTHISGIETGRIVPRFDTLLDIVRVLDRDLLMVPRALVPAVQALIRGEGERPLYAVDDNEQDRSDET
jgi:transcriptional regulator with XRE-family HTH domain